MACSSTQRSSPLRTRPAPGRHAALLATLALLSLLSGGQAAAVSRDTVRTLRDHYEGMTLRLRIDLMPAAHAAIPNVVSAEGVAHARERGPILFGRMERVYLERLTSEGGRRLGLTIYRSREEMERLRASAIPQPAIVNPGYNRAIAAFARQGSTSVVLELRADKKDAAAQRDEIDALLRRVFWLEGEPSHEEMAAFVRDHPDMTVGRLHALTGLDNEEIRALREGNAAAPPP